MKNLRKLRAVISSEKAKIKEKMYRKISHVVDLHESGEEEELSNQDVDTPGCCPWLDSCPQLSFFCFLTFLLNN